MLFRSPGTAGYTVRCIWDEGERDIVIPGNGIGEMIAVFQKFLDGYAQQTGCTLDYIHREDATAALSGEAGRVGFVLPAMDKADFFATALAGTVFPKKSFSIGRSNDKRYYLECRKLRPDNEG